MNPDTLYACAALLLASAVFLFVFLRWRTEHAKALQLMGRAPSDPAARTKRALTVVPSSRSSGSAITCANCAHFDHELGQRELAAHPPMVGAMAHIPPWRMGRQMKVDAEGKHLPLSEQGVAKNMLLLRWEDMGACVEHTDLRAPFDTCPQFATRPVEAA